MDRMRYIYSVAVFLLAVTAAAFPAPPQLPSDPAVTYGTLPNGLTYYIVTNPSEKGMAEFALVRRRGADAGSHQEHSDAVLRARASVTVIPRVSGSSVRDYASRNGAASQLCRKDAPVGVRVTPDAVVYRFGSYPVSGRDVLIDSTLLMIFSIVENAVDGEMESDAIIVSGDVSKDAVLSKMKLLSLMVPPVRQMPVDTSYAWKERTVPECTVKVDSSAAAARISITYSSPRTPREYMSSVVPTMTEYLVGVLDRVLGRRISVEMGRRDIPVSGIRFRYAGSRDLGGDETYTVSVTVDNGKVKEAVSVLTGIVADLDVNGAREKEYSGARNEYLVQQYRRSLDPVVCNSAYVDECISSFLYGSVPVSVSDRFGFLVRGDLPDSTLTRLFNRYVSELFDDNDNLRVSVVADSLYLEDDAVLSSFMDAWKKAALADTLTAYASNRCDSLVLPDVPTEKLKVEKTLKESVSGGTMWTFSNGMKVVYKRMSTGGLFYYDLMLRGGYSVVKDLRSGEGAFYSDILETFDISGLRSEDFNDMMLSEGITMSSRVTASDMDIYGLAPRPSLTLLFKCLKAVANDRRVNSRAFEYYAKCEKLRLAARAGSLSGRKAAIDSLMCPSYHYSSEKSPENLFPDACARAESFFNSSFSRVNDGVLVIVGDMEETAMKRFLQRNLHGFKTEPMSSARIRLPYQPISGWTTHIVDGRRQSLDVAMSVPVAFTAGNYMAMKVAASALENELARRFVGTGASVRVFSEFSGYPQERVNFLVSVTDLDIDSLPLDETGRDPLVLLYDVRAVLSDMSSAPLPDDRIAVCRDMVKNMILSLQNTPEYWTDMVRARFAYGKDLNTGYAEKVDSVQAEKVREIISGLASAGRVEYIVR